MKVIFGVGISALDALGSVTRMLAIAQQLRKNMPDSELLFRLCEDEAHLVNIDGFKSVNGYKPGMMGMPVFLWQWLKPMFINEKKDLTVPNIESMEQVVHAKGIFTKAYVIQTFKEWNKLIDEFQPDIVCTEFDLVAPIACKKRSIIHINTLQTPMLSSYKPFGRSFKSNQRLVKHYNKLLNKIGLNRIPSVLDLLSGNLSDASFVPSICKLEELDKSSKVHYTGMLIPETVKQTQKFEFKKKRPLIYVYLSICKISGSEIERVLPECFNKKDCDVLVSCAGSPYLLHKIETEGEGYYLQKGNVQFHKFLPAEKLVKEADLVIHHGGQNTTIQCIEARVPALIFPGRHFERHFNAKMAAQSKCAFLMDINNFNPEDLKKYADKAMDDIPMKIQMRLLSNDIKVAGGANYASQILLNLIHDNE